MIRISKSNPADELARRGEIRCEISGTSMQPLLNSKKTTVHICLLKEDPLPLDVVLFTRDDGSFVLHRIVGLSKGAYTLCGDNQTEVEFGIKRHQILGRMEGYYRGDLYHSCSGLSYRLYSLVWTYARPLRSLWLALVQKLGGKNL